MIIKCGKCGARYKIRDELVGNGTKRAKCKKCGEPMLIRPAAEKPGSAAETGSAPGPSAADSAQVPAQSADVSSGSAAETADRSVQDQESTDRPAQSTEAQTDKPAEAPESDQEEVEGRETAEPAQGEEKPGVAQQAELVESESEESGSGEKSKEQESAEDDNKNQEDIQAKLEKRRREMEDEISGRLNKATLETLDFDILSELANRIKDIEQNTDYKPEKDTQLFACIQCKSIFSLFPDDPRLCTNCSGEISLVRGEDILRQFGMFG